jgi:hypothetical protein
MTFVSYGKKTWAKSKYDILKAILPKRTDIPYGKVQYYEANRISLFEVLGRF